MYMFLKAIFNLINNCSFLWRPDLNGSRANLHTGFSTATVDKRAEPRPKRPHAPDRRRRRMSHDGQGQLIGRLRRPVAPLAPGLVDGAPEHAIAARRNEFDDAAIVEPPM